MSPYVGDAYVREGASAVERGIWLAHDQNLLFSGTPKDEWDRDTFEAAARVIEAQLGDSLDAAWAEAEAALPPNAALELSAFRAAPGRYVATAHDGDHLPYLEMVGGDTPAAALRALTAKLRERKG